MLKGFSGACTETPYTSPSLKYCCHHYDCILSGSVQTPWTKPCLWANVWLFLTSAGSWVKGVSWLGEAVCLLLLVQAFSDSVPAHFSTASIQKPITTQPIRIQIHLSTHMLGRVSSNSAHALTVDRKERSLTER